LDATAAPAAATPSTPKSDPLGRDAFLSLLITQLQHQDPMQPQENGEFLAQLAQFSSLESLQQIKEDMTALRALVETSAATTTATTTGPSTTTAVKGGF
jgi:flagellar basal-body rod modification protein FlgD